MSALASLRLPEDAAIVILTGAGISRESGLHTFRDADGVWAKVRIEDVATPEAFRRDPMRVHEFYNARRRQLVTGGIAPNAAHRALARLERDWPGEVLLVTQNVDDLHDRAGHDRLLHMHGELLKAKCEACGWAGAWTEDLSTATPCPACAQSGGLRPDVVWFHEYPYHMDAIAAALDACDLFVSIGTSGQVYPAAGFAAQARAAGAVAIELNLEATGGAFDLCLEGPATMLAPELVEILLAARPKG